MKTRENLQGICVKKNISNANDDYSEVTSYSGTCKEPAVTI